MWRCRSSTSRPTGGGTRGSDRHAPVSAGVTEMKEMRVTRKRLYDLVNMPWVWVPMWLRARRFAKLRASRLDSEHIEWSATLAEQSRSV